MIQAGQRTMKIYFYINKKEYNKRSCIIDFKKTFFFLKRNMYSLNEYETNYSEFGYKNASKIQKIHHLKINLKSNSNIFNQVKNPREQETKKNAKIGDNYSHNSYSSL